MRRNILTTIKNFKCQDAAGHRTAKYYIAKTYEILLKKSAKMGTEHSTEAYHLAHSKYKAHNPKLWG